MKWKYSVLTFKHSTSEINLCVFKNERSTTYNELSELAAEIGAVKKVYKEINAAINEIVSDTLYNETIIICGSFFLISDIKLSLLKQWIFILFLTIGSIELFLLEI